MVSLLKADADEGESDFLKSNPGNRQPVPATEKPGDWIGRYKLLEQIGEGGMGTVWVAEQTEPVKRRVALKLIKPGMDSRQVLSRFEAERQALALMDHPNIAKVYDGGMTDEGRPFFVMEYVKGMPITEYCDHVRLSIADRLKLFVPVCQAVQHAHHKGIIHRDLKPGNILLDRSGQALLTDFGLAREIDAEERLTLDGIIVGTPSYMSPEQATGANSNLGPAADLYSLGIVLYEMFTGKLPFRGSLCEVLQRIVVEPATSPAEHRPDLDPRLVALVLKAIAKNPADRHLSAQSFGAELQSWLDSASVATDPNLAAAPFAVPIATPTPEKSPTEIPPRRSSRWRHRVGWGMAAALMVAFGYGIYGSGIGNKREKREPLTAERDLETATSVDVPLAGDIDITVSSRPEKLATSVTMYKSGVRISEPGELPLKNGRFVRLQARLNRPAYLYLLWVDTDGSVLPLYPWDAEHSSQRWDAPVVASASEPVQLVQVPSLEHPGFRTSGPGGFQTVLLLARSTPLEQEVNLHAILGELPASPLREVAWLDSQKRGIVLGPAEDMEDPILSQLEQRLRPHFDLIRMLRFAQVEPDSTR
jgi:serine/threonine protein kinase